MEEAAMFEGLRRRSTLVASIAAEAEKRDKGETGGIPSLLEGEGAAAEEPKSPPQANRQE